MSIKHPIRPAIIKVTLNDGNFTVESYEPGNSGPDTVIRSSGGGAGFNLKGKLAILIVTGETVSVKPYRTDDPIIKRIIQDKSLYVTLHENDEPYPHLDFIRKGQLEGLMQIMKENRVLVIKTVIAKSAGNDVLSDTASAAEKELTCRTVWKDSRIREFLAEETVRRSFLPALIIFLVILTGNFIVRKDIVARTEKVRADYIAGMQQVRAKAAVSERQAALIAEYDRFTGTDIPYMADRIAYCVPSGARLTELSFSYTSLYQENHNVLSSIKGEALDADCIALLTDSLSAIPVSEVNIVSINKARNGSMLNFEINLPL